MLQVVPATKPSRDVKETVHRFFRKLTIPRGVKQPTIYDMGLGKELPQDLKGKIVWEPLGHIGEGGGGKVYRGKCKLGRGNKVWVAIKFLEMRAGSNMDIKIVQYLHRETLVWRDLKHPNILPLLGICSDLNNPTTRVPALISPYCPHGNLREYLERHPDVPRLPLAHQVVRLSTNTSSKTQYIMPQDNILINEEGRPLLSDFGRSRIIGVDGFETTLTSSQHYTAPELLNYEEDIVPLTKPSDIFSLSVTLLRVITDRDPFHPRRGPILGNLFREGKKPTLEVYLDHPLMSLGLWDLLDKGWSYDPAKRQNADEVMEALEALPVTPSVIE
ncbi:hypothetical protein PTI98_011935 [Pleurotus ostreatus]|nr:hypothetical protein PTI98_011935 [Pleurotus ostreatus]